jgi:hypothetical protein
MSLLRGIAKLVLGIFLLAGIRGMLGNYLAYFPIQNLLTPPMKAFLTGGFLFILMEWVYFSRKGRFWATLSHELSHAVFALLFLRPVHRLSATRQRGGMVEIEGGNFVIALAPYAFPLASLLILAISTLIQNNYHLLLAGAVGFTYFFHLTSLVKEAYPSQPDLVLSGRLFSYLYILFFNLLFLMGIVLGINGQWEQIVAFLRDSGHTVWQDVSATGHFLLNRS